VTAVAGASLLAAVRAGMLVLVGAVAGQAPFDARELSDYRLTPAMFERFVDASRRIADITRNDASLANAPLFTDDIVRSDDVTAAARDLLSRLESHRRLSAALAAAKITAREYTKFAIALVAGRVAHGFLESGVLRRVPDGAPAANVGFVDRHRSEVLATLALLGIRD